jgi:2-oxoisovalerate dehydrogenase E1 component alpha subunit
MRGFGAVSWHAARFLAGDGARVIAASDSKGAAFDRDGLDIGRLQAQKAEGGSYGRLRSREACDELIGIDCDILIPAALPDVIRKDTVERLRARVIPQGSSSRCERVETGMTDEELPVVAHFDVRRRSYLAPDGTVLRKPPEFLQDAAALIPLYRAVVLTRAFDLKAVSLQRTGRLGTYAVSLGQEAVSVGVASAMRAEDVLLPSYRDNGALLWRGVKMEEILLYWGGDERGSRWSGPAHDFPFCVPVGSQAPHAAGVAYAFKLRNEPRVAVCFLGDGATSKGDMYEAMNFAGIHKLPVVFLVNNNQWAISVPLRLQTACQTLAQKAIAAGIASEQVDGNDVLAVRAAAEGAIAAVRAGKGPRLVEGVTYRLGDHTTADDATRYRSPEEVQARWKEDPVARLRAYLVGQKVWAKAEEEALSAQCQGQIDAAVERYLAIAPRAPETMLDHLYAVLPSAYRVQRDELKGAPDA